MSRWKLFEALSEGYKVPRKAKKRVLGKRLSHSTLKVMLKSLTIGPPIKTMFERVDIKPYPFCPNCGCWHYFGGGNMTTYPEHWERFRCLRCGRVVGYIDNSPFIHALECADNNYDPEF